uniref:Uncharacterized protein n=1 Tax=Anguilla anguilla TaxID=7936 RepID=A0A0E9UGG3_ANGAN
MLKPCLRIFPCGAGAFSGS